MAAEFYGSYSFLDVTCTFSIGHAAGKSYGDGGYSTDTWFTGIVGSGTFTITGDRNAMRGISQEGIVIPPVESRNIMAYGADRSVIHNLVATKPATCTINLLRVSPINQIFAEIYEKQTTSAFLHGYNSIELQVGSRTCLKLKGVAFNNPPETTFAREMSMLAWPFDVADLSVIYSEIAILQP